MRKAPVWTCCGGKKYVIGERCGKCRQSFGESARGWARTCCGGIRIPAGGRCPVCGGAEE